MNWSLKRQMLPIFISALALLIVFTNRIEVNGNYIHIISSESENLNETVILNSKTTPQLIENLALLDIEKIDDYVYLMGENGSFAFRLDNVNQIYSSEISNAGSINIISQFQDQIIYNVNGENTYLCISQYNFSQEYCQQINEENNSLIINSIYVENDMIYTVVSEEQTNNKLLNIYNQNLELQNSKVIQGAKGNLGIIDTNYIFEFTHEGLTIYDRNLNPHHYVSEYYEPVNSNPLEIEDAFKIDHTYYFATSNNLFAVDEFDFNSPRLVTTYNRYMYHESDYIYFIRNEFYSKYNVIKRTREKISIDNYENQIFKNFIITK